MPKKSDALIKVENEINDIKKYMAEMAKKKDGIPGGSITALCERIEKIEQSLNNLHQDQDSRLSMLVENVKQQLGITNPPDPEKKTEGPAPKQQELFEELYI